MHVYKAPSAIALLLTADITDACTALHAAPLQPCGRNAKDVASLPICGFTVQSGAPFCNAATGAVALSKAMSFWVPAMPAPFALSVAVNTTCSPGCPMTRLRLIEPPAGVPVGGGVLVGVGGDGVLVADPVGLAVGVGSTGPATSYAPMSHA